MASSSRSGALIAFSFTTFTIMLSRIRKEFFDIHKDEWPKALALSLFFFLVIAVFWVLKPIKKGALIGFYSDSPMGLFGLTFGGAEVEQLAKVVNMIVVYGVVVLYTLLVRRFERQQVIYIFCATISALLVAFAVALIRNDPLTAWSFYVFGDIFNSVMVVSFWAFTNDVIKPEQSKRLYGIIGLGGVVGGAIGATFVSQYVENVGRPPLLLACIAAMAVIAGITYFVNERSTKHRKSEEDETQVPVSAAIEGAKLVFSSRYLLAILGLIGLYEIVSNIIEFQLSATVETSGIEGAAIDSFFGTVGMWISLVSIGAQLFLTPFLMKRFGVGAALFVLPIADLIFSGGFLLFPALGIAAALSVVDNAFNYSINQSAKEALYTPTSRDAKYKAKAFIDMFVQRAAKVLAVVLNLIFAAVVGIAGVRWLSIASLVVLALWLALVHFASRGFQRRAEEQQETATA